MSDYLMREDAPLSAEEWKKLDEVVVMAARQFLVGRRFIELVGPLGVGTEVVPVGSGDDRRLLRLQLIHEDFTLFWRDVEANRKAELPLDLGRAAMASVACAQAEDEMIFGELLTAEGRLTARLGNWDEPGAAFVNVVAATEKLVSEGLFGPFAVIVSPALYAKTQRVVEGMGRLESKLIKDVAGGGLFRSPVLAADQGLVISLGAYNFDLVVAQDLVTAYMGNEGLDHLFRVMESLVLRIKRPQAICTLET